jgi:hypothetical protein
MGVTLVSLSLIVPSPPATLVVLTAELSPGERWDLATSHRAIASYKVTFGPRSPPRSSTSCSDSSDVQARRLQRNVAVSQLTIPDEQAMAEAAQKAIEELERTLGFHRNHHDHPLVSSLPPASPRRRVGPHPA